ncbi:unnamed protein product [Cercospora beticola]|nr:unnamed protein product [Cercospora beticola]
MSTVLFILKDTGEPAKIFQRQMEDSLRYEFAWPFQAVEDYDTKMKTPHRYSDTRPEGELYIKDRERYLDHLAILAELPAGARHAVEKTTMCAHSDFECYSFARTHDDLHKLDYFALKVTWTEVRLGRGLEWEAYGQLESYITLIQSFQRKMAEYSIEHLMNLVQGKYGQSYRFSPERWEEVKDLMHQTDHEAFVKERWFPSTLRYLREVERQRVCDFLLERIAGHVLPVELQNAISAFFYDADFVLRAPIVARRATIDRVEQAK